MRRRFAGCLVRRLVRSRGSPGAYRGGFVLFFSELFFLPVCVEGSLPVLRGWGIGRLLREPGSPGAQRGGEKVRRVLVAAGLHRRNGIRENDRMAIVL